VGVSLRAVKERCLSPISSRRTSRTLPRGETARHQASDCRQTHTLPATTSDARRPALAHPRTDDSTAWLECTYFGAEIRQIEPPVGYRVIQNDTMDIQMTSSSSNDHVALGTDTVSTEYPPSRQFEHGDGEGTEVEGNPWLRQQACSRGMARCGQPVTTSTTKVLRRRHSHDCTLTSTNIWTKFPASLPVNRTASDEFHLPNSRYRTYSGGSLTTVGHGDVCRQQDTAADNATSLCLAHEILHELEEDLVEPSEPPSSHYMRNIDSNNQQMATAASASRQSSTDDVTVSSSSPSSSSTRCSNKAHCDGEGCDVANVSNTSQTAAVTDDDAVRDLSMDDDVCDAASHISPALPTSSAQLDAPSETIVGTLKNMFAYFIAKLGGNEDDRKETHSEPESQRQRTSTSRSCDGLSRTVCRTDRKLPAGKNGASLSAAVYLVEVLTSGEAGDMVGQRLALPIPSGTLDRVLSLVPRRAVHGLSRCPRRRRNTTGNIDVVCHLRRRPSVDDDAGQSAVLRRRPRSVSVSSDWIWTSVASPSSSSSSSSFYERKMISDLEHVGGAANTDVDDAGEGCLEDLCTSDVGDNEDDDKSVFVERPHHSDGCSSACELSPTCLHQREMLDFISPELMGN